MSSDWKEDRDDDEVLEDADELYQEAYLIQKILAGEESLTLAEMETVSYSTRLRDVYNDRWWKPELPAFFAHIDQGFKPTKAGVQLYYQYGQRSDDFLVDNYGFCLDPGENPFSAWKFRVVIGSKVGPLRNSANELSDDEILGRLLP